LNLSPKTWLAPYRAKTKRGPEMKIHPYAILFGVIIGIGFLLALRHPPFAILMTLVSIVGLDYFFKNKSKVDNDKNKKP
jgi:hypothetical protein